jgi:hypothetical protein
MAVFTPTTDPMIIPAPALTATTSVVFAHRPIQAKRIEWYNPNAVGDTVQVTDLGGNVLAQGTCEVALQSQIIWAGPQKLNLPENNKAGTTGWQVINAYASASTAALIIWY